MQIMKVNITFVFQEFFTLIFFCLYHFYFFLVNLGNHMLPVPEAVIQTISLSTRKLELPRILYIHKYWKIKHLKHAFSFFSHLNKLSHSNAWPGTASIYIYIYIYIYISELIARDDDDDDIYTFH